MIGEMLVGGIIMILTLMIISGTVIAVTKERNRGGRR